MKVHSQTAKDDLKRRLRRVEGQVRGVQKMVDGERECDEIIQQLNAINAAVRNATQTFVRAYAKECLLRAQQEEKSVDGGAMVDELLDLIAKVR